MKIITVTLEQNRLRVNYSRNTPAFTTESQNVCFDKSLFKLASYQCFIIFCIQYQHGYQLNAKLMYWRAESDV